MIEMAKRRAKENGKSGANAGAEAQNEPTEEEQNAAVKLQAHARVRSSRRTTHSLRAHKKHNDKVSEFNSQGEYVWMVSEFQ